jgi:hypothetical protein
MQSRIRFADAAANTPRHVGLLFAICMVQYPNELPQNCNCIVYEYTRNAFLPLEFLKDDACLRIRAWASARDSLMSTATCSTAPTLLLDRTSVPLVLDWAVLLQWKPSLHSQLRALTPQNTWPAPYRSTTKCSAISRHEPSPCWSELLQSACLRGLHSPS